MKHLLTTEKQEASERERKVFSRCSAFCFWFFFCFWRRRIFFSVNTNLCSVVIFRSFTRAASSLRFQVEEFIILRSFFCSSLHFLLLHSELQRRMHLRPNAAARDQQHDAVANKCRFLILLLFGDNNFSFHSTKKNFCRVTFPSSVDDGDTWT